MASQSQKSATTVRSGTKQSLVLSTLRAEIVAGQYSPGDRLPRQEELAGRFGVSGYTVQQALESLAHAGFLYSNKRAGTYVREHPPHLSRYALVFHGHPSVSHDEIRWSRFWSALSNEANEVELSSPRRIPRFYFPSRHPDGPELRKLLAEAAADRLAGVIFVGLALPQDLAGTELMRMPGLPRVGIVVDRQVPGIDAKVATDQQGFVDRAFEAFVRDGRRRVAVLTVDPTLRDVWSRVSLAARAHGLVVPPRRVQHVHWTITEWARHAVTGLFPPGQESDWPDALLIDDDNIIEPALAGLMETGARVPEQVEVIAHCNFSAPVPAILPIRRLGHDDRVMLHTCLGLIDRLRAGQAVATMTYIPPLFEEELGRTPATAAPAELNVMQ